MKWGECKLRALQTMYANSGAVLTEDQTNEDYIHAMPGKANEAMTQLCLVGKPLIKKLEICIGVTADAANDRVILPIREGNYRLQLTDYAPRFRAVAQLLAEVDGDFGMAGDYAVVGECVLVLPGELAATYTLYYKARPIQITAETADTAELELAEEAAALVPIYMAAELYKEDELALATVLRNEYEDGLEKLRAAAMEEGGMRSYGLRKNTTGWW